MNYGHYKFQLKLKNHPSASCWWESTFWSKLLAKSSLLIEKQVLTKLSCISYTNRNGGFDQNKDFVEWWTKIVKARAFLRYVQILGLWRVVLRIGLLPGACVLFDMELLFGVWGFVGVYLLAGVCVCVSRWTGVSEDLVFSQSQDPN